MNISANFLRRHEIIMLAVLMLIAAVFLSLRAFVVLADYDEATYAKTVVDTLNSGDIASLTLSGLPFLEKPPLYFWLAMGSVKIFGYREFAFRLPAILAALVCYLLVYLIVRELTGNVLAAAAAFLVLLFTPFFYYFAKEARLDQGVIMSILAALYFWIRGRSQATFLFWIFPALAIAFLFKSIIAFLFMPIVLIYCLFYWQWSWLASKYLWLGLLPALVILLPWHMWETFKYGSNFWEVYFFQQSFGRTLTTITGTNGYLDYLQTVWIFTPVWLLSFIAAMSGYACLFFSKRWRSSVSWREIGAPLCTAIVLFILFSTARTHLLPYMMPVFPFAAMFVGILYHGVSSVFPSRSYLAALIFLPFIIIGFCYYFAENSRVPLSNVVDEAASGKLYKERGATEPLYAIDEGNVPTVNYYAGTVVKNINSITDSGVTIKGPFYAIVYNEFGNRIIFRDMNNALQSWYGQSILYVGADYSLIYSPRDFTMP